jgi:hypothetical protein
MKSARINVTITILAVLVGMVGPIPTVARGLSAALAMVLGLHTAGRFARWTVPAPAEHLQRASTPAAPAPMPRIPPSMFAGLSAQPAAPEPSPGIDPYTGEILEDQPQSSAGAEPERPSPLPCPAKNPLAEPIEPPSAPVGPGTFVRWTKNGRDGLGQIMDVGTEAVEIRPFLPARSNRVTVSLHSITTLTPHELAEALQ